ncbi:unnamed protein product [Vitrella brassicaformis CCMP3155]|uniref:Uncharacterized protein n=1 Tax=Vitrella brassicaformis (strain CCMP3155) TaxID=1169540 RepID=A0A0G4G759_VITBC|nr:unnamed protein product [Vitrella brassicaformis CCMP3155]|eukprot:CEM24059.1 unnamed protein product [Vitrella brassicaformis CCMP3155]
MDVSEAVKDRIIAQLSRLLEQDAASIAAPASSPEAWVLNYQLGSMASLLNALTTQLEQGEPGLAGAVDALTPTTEAAAAAGPQHPEAQAPVVAGPSYRLIHQSGTPPPIHQGPARRWLSRDELANAFGHLQPWELTRYRRPLGTPLFHQSAANYTHLVIDCEDDTARRMWEAMPLAVAHIWGERATSIREIKHRHPRGQESWCRGTWVAVVEGHGRGRAANAEKKRRERAGGEGAAAAAAVGQDDDGGRSADQGTLEMLLFEAVKLHDSIDMPDSIPSSDLPPAPTAPTAPIHLPALTTIDSIPSDHCLWARVGRQWHTPAVKTLTIRGGIGEEDVEGARSWLADCADIEVLHLSSCVIDGGDADDVAGMLSVLPADGKSLAALRTLRGVDVEMYDRDPAAIDRLREVMVARGVSRSIRELEIDMRSMGSTPHDVERCQSVARLIDAIAHPEAVKKGVFTLCHDGTCGEIDEALLSRSSTGPAATQQLIRDFAKRAGTVMYLVDDDAVPATITDASFPAAHTLSPSPMRPRRSGRSRSPPTCPTCRASRQMSPLFVRCGGSSSSCRRRWSAGGGRGACGVEDDQLEQFYDNVMASVASFSNELKGHRKTCVRLLCDALRTDFKRRFMAQQANLNLSGGPYKLSLEADGLCVERRNAATDGHSAAHEGC